MVEIYLTAAAVVSCGAIWFYFVRPMLEDWGVLQPRESVNDSAEAPPVVMSRAEPRPAPSAPVVLGRTEPEARTDMPTWTREDQKALYTLLRKYGVKREELRPLLKPFGVPLSNDVWAESASDDDLTVTPFAGRVTRRSYYENEPDLEYERPPA